MDKTSLGDLEKEFLVLNRNCWLVSAYHLENGRIHIWSWHKDCSRHDKGNLGRHIILDRNRQTTVGLGIRLSRNPICHFPLHHHDKLTKRNSALNQMHENRRRNVVGQVCYYLDRQIRIFKLCHVLSQINLENILIDHGHIVKIAQSIRQNRHQTIINLKSHDLGGTFRQKFCQRPNTRPNLDDIDLFVNLSRIHNLLEDVGISQEILTERFFKGETVTLQNGTGHTMVCNSHLFSFLFK